MPGLATTVGVDVSVAANGVAVGVVGRPGHPSRVLSTAWISRATVTGAPLGTPYGQADSGALPSAMLTRVTSEPDAAGAGAVTVADAQGRERHRRRACRHGENEHRDDVQQPLQLLRPPSAASSVSPPGSCVQPCPERPFRLTRAQTQRWSRACRPDRSLRTAAGTTVATREALHKSAHATFLGIGVGIGIAIDIFTQCLAMSRRNSDSDSDDTDTDRAAKLLVQSFPWRCWGDQAVRGAGTGAS